MEYAGKNASYSRSGSSEALARFCFTEKAAPIVWEYLPVSIDIGHLDGSCRQGLPPVGPK